MTVPADTCNTVGRTPIPSGPCNTVIVQSTVMCVKRASNIISLCQFPSLTTGSPMLGLLPLAFGQAFNSISSVNGGMVIPP
jgi:hypothetical protein